MGNGKEEFLWPTDMGIKVASELAECQLTLELEAPEEAKVKLARPPHPDFGSDSIYLI